MDNKLFGIDLNAPVTPLMVRDAIVTCFWDAHCKDAGMGPEDSETNKTYCKTLVEKAFKETGGDFAAPSKDSIIKCTDYLASFSSSFRDPSLIQKHYLEIGQLIDKLP